VPAIVLSIVLWNHYNPCPPFTCEKEEEVTYIIVVTRKQKIPDSGRIGRHSKVK
jgi:hypothetical protein